MMIPTVHMNGTSVDTLRDQLGEAAARIKDAIDALYQAGPNGRDYYPQGEYAINAAMVEHKHRVERLQSVYREIEEMFFAVDQQDAA